MNRFTCKDDVGVYVSSDDCFGDWETPERFRGDAIRQLSSYEDTGLSPSDVLQLKLQLKTAINQLKGQCRFCIHFNERLFFGCTACEIDMNHTNWEWNKKAKRPEVKV